MTTLINKMINDKYLNNLLKCNSLEVRSKNVSNLKILDVCYIPKMHEHEKMLTHNYNLSQLKTIAKTYKIVSSGNKTELFNRIYKYLLVSSMVTRVQKLFRGYMQRKLNSYHGPAYLNRKLCINAVDFLSMDELTNVPSEQFFSFKDEDGFIYGFDLLSLYNLIDKNKACVKNPFSTKQLSTKILQDFNALLKLSKKLKIGITTRMTDITSYISESKRIEFRTLDLFQHIDSLGNYSKPEWFLRLEQTDLIAFIKELIDIWVFRADLSKDAQKIICPPQGNPFDELPQMAVLNSCTINQLRAHILKCLEKLARNGINNENKSLGAYYILGALTLVSHDAATCMPWLYQSLSHDM